MKRYINELNKLKVEDLVKKEAEIRGLISDVSKNIAMGNTINYKTLGKHKRQLARVKTLLNVNKKKVEVK